MDSNGDRCRQSTNGGRDTNHRLFTHSESNRSEARALATNTKLGKVIACPDAPHKSSHTTER